MASLRDLAAKVLDGTVVLSPRGLARESDDQIAARLSAVRGIGPWTAEMFSPSAGTEVPRRERGGRSAGCG
jgi:DNA-3-methyladenine glycosylase II